MLESTIQAQIVKRLGSSPLCRIWRHETGLAYWPDGTPVRIGLPGSGDLIGVLADGRFLSLEVKTPTGRQTQQQQKFQKMVELFNGVYILAQSAEQAEELVRKALDKQAK